MNIYRQLGDQAGTSEARELADRLVRWHDTMVRHLRSRRAACDDRCPHAGAAHLWTAARDTFGHRADALRFLREHGARLDLHL